MKIISDNTKELSGKRQSAILRSRGAMLTLALVLSFALSIAAYVLFVGPQFKKVGIGRTYDVVTLNAELASKENTLNQLTELDKNLSELSESEIDLIARVLPNDKLVPELLAQIEVIAQTSGVSLASINIAEIDDSEQLSTRQQLQKQLSDTQATKKESTLKKISVRLSITAGNYQAFERFIESLESHTRIMDIQRFNYGTENQFHSVTVTTYYLES
jgi:Tfp pilus assembly protein PilO